MPETVTFRSGGSPAAQLEGLYQRPEGRGPWPAVVICHPHPLGGGTMRNTLVAAIAGALVSSNVLALRFNFRGVQGSSGQHDGGQGEQKDVAGAIDWLLARAEVDRRQLFVIGYSFGAWVGAVHAQGDARVAAIGAVSLPAWYYDRAFRASPAALSFGVEDWQCDPELLRGFHRPKLFVNGAQDTFAPLEALGRLAKRLPPPTHVRILPTADHFYAGHEDEVSRLVAAFVTGSRADGIEADIGHSRSSSRL
jgi:uncharacterized protein